jgi:hypothetical protein
VETYPIFDMDSMTCRCTACRCCDWRMLYTSHLYYRTDLLQMQAQTIRIFLMPIPQRNSGVQLGSRFQLLKFHLHFLGPDFSYWERQEPRQRPTAPLMHPSSDRLCLPFDSPADRPRPGIPGPSVVLQPLTWNRRFPFSLRNCPRASGRVVGVPRMAGAADPGTI